MVGKGGLAMIHLNNFLADAAIDPQNTLVMRHTPTEKPLRLALAAWAAERPEMYNAYQRSHLPRQEKMLVRAQRLVSCLGHEPGQALFVGVYEVQGFRPISNQEYWAMPEHQEMRALGSTIRSSTLWFDLQLMPALKKWSGKLAIEWPPPERAWVRWANKNTFSVHAIHQESHLVPPLPPWREIVLDWKRLRVLPKSWEAQLSQWRGVYLIQDTSDGKCYVGSAYGEQNIYGRWLDYASTGDGGNKKLRERNPANFLFSILERVGPDVPPDEVVPLENTWKIRLHTRERGLNVN
jgi:hypothetical protein